MRMWLRSLALLTGLKIQRCHIAVSCGVRLQMRLRFHVAVAVVQAGSCSSNSTPRLRTSICCGCGHQKKKKGNKPSIFLSPWNFADASYGSKILLIFTDINDVFLFFSFYSWTHGMWKFLGQGLYQSCRCRRTPQPQQHGIRATSGIYTAACRNAGSLIHWVRPGIEPHLHGHNVGFLTHWATMGIPWCVSD